MKKKFVQEQEPKKRIKLKATGASIVAEDFYAYKEQLSNMTDEELVAHKRSTMKGHDGLAADYWNRMWSINAEMANRFAKAVRKEEER